MCAAKIAVCGVYSLLSPLSCNDLRNLGRFDSCSAHQLKRLFSPKKTGFLLGFSVYHVCNIFPFAIV
jgi:hypothetical protein